MKNLTYLSLLISLILLSCKETVVQNPVQNGSLFIDSKPQGAKIFIQGTFENHYTPYTINDLAPDSYDIEVEVEPGVDSSFVVEVKSNLTTSATIDFEEKMGRCYFNSDPPGAQIFLDGINSNKVTPSLISYLKKGFHNYKLQLANNVIEDSFYISPGQLIDIYRNFNSLLPKGSIYVSTNPLGAQIWVDSQNTGKVTPDSVTGLSAGSHSVKLTLSGYKDTTFTVNVVANQQTVKQITLVSTLSLSSFGPVRIYESAGTTASQPSGLDLSSGNAYGMSGTNNDKVDIYYSTSGTGGTPYLIQSADLFTNLTRHTFFFIANGTDINDGVNSPIYPLGGSWTNNIGDGESNYVFLYDEDGHYSKLIITNFGGGSGQNDPHWLEVKWLYNNTGTDNRF